MQCNRLIRSLGNAIRERLEVICAKDSEQKKTNINFDSTILDTREGGKLDTSKAKSKIYYDMFINKQMGQHFRYQL